MRILRMPLGIYAANCYIVGCEDTKKACVIDPGGDAEKIAKVLENENLDLEIIALTHAHADHIGGVEALRNIKKVPVVIHEIDGPFLEDPKKNLSANMGAKISIQADRFLKEGDKVTFGNINLKVIHTPGHTPGGICFKYDKTLFAGDTLFLRSVGRTDLYGGDYNALVQSIKKKLYRLPEDTVVYPGHGAETSIGFEKVSNMVVTA